MLQAIFLCLSCLFPSLFLSCLFLSRRPFQASVRHSSFLCLCLCPCLIGLALCSLESPHQEFCPILVSGHVWDFALLGHKVQISDDDSLCSKRLASHPLLSSTFCIGKCRNCVARFERRNDADVDPPLGRFQRMEVTCTCTYNMCCGILQCRAGPIQLRVSAP